MLFSPLEEDWLLEPLTDPAAELFAGGDPATDRHWREKRLLAEKSLAVIHREVDFHDLGEILQLNRRGEVVRADIVTPTAHNFLGLEENLRKLIEADMDDEPHQISKRCEMLFRAYDPCFSCSVH